jgi:predicted RNA-binding Zn-ribbon protein involved in translation (DUF1610 family)
MTEKDAVPAHVSEASGEDSNVVECTKCGIPGESFDEVLTSLRCPDCGYEWSA